ncbi:hypothetical protein [Brevibacillus sp. MS2.2]|nr:hypothetical protein [Brevibacillus sp. MS2.2]NRR20608.1 hypothetical protein [Brevibacillus sp. MS2.2]
MVVNYPACNLSGQQGVLLAGAFPQCFGFARVYGNLPTGAIVAFADLVGCHKVIGNKGNVSAYLSNSKVVDGHELLFGYFDFGRYAWEMANVKPIDPVPTKG